MVTSEDGDEASASRRADAVSLRDLGRRFGDVTAVDGNGLDIRDGEFFSMLSRQQGPIVNVVAAGVILLSTVAICLSQRLPGDRGWRTAVTIAWSRLFRRNPSKPGTGLAQSVATNYLGVAPTSPPTCKGPR